MHIISTFEHSTFLELAISDLEQKGITKKQVVVIPLEKFEEQKNILDNIHRADGISLFDGAAALGTACMVLGSIYGFILEWGPIVWGLIGLFAGAFLGFIFDFFIGKRNKIKLKNKTNRQSEVVVIVHCQQEQLPIVENVLKDHQAIGIGRYQGSQ